MLVAPNASSLTGPLILSMTKQVWWACKHWLGSIINSERCSASSNDYLIHDLCLSQASHVAIKVMKRMEGAYGGIRETTGAEEREAIIPIAVKPSNNLETCFTRQKWWRGWNVVNEEEEKQQGQKPGGREATTEGRVKVRWMVPMLLPRLSWNCYFYGDTCVCY